ncbi:uncharacterized protein TNCV_243611 [Trichonephila clavipes]|uniref:BESS domain-containing protein n=1 Tax=Trichonephila clavipes TaxID=2585209 RepID=A0A8X6W4J8_TRICX|nr:uncharacterized protein TNCV_243611 [Trichonephila clavipes]
MGAECEVAGRYDRHSGSNSLLHVFLDSGGKKMSSNIFWTLEEDEILIDFFVKNKLMFVGSDCCKRWGYVRDYYIRRRGKPGSGSSGIAAKKRSELLSFLDSFAASQRPTTTNVGSSQGLSDVTQLSSTDPDIDSGPGSITPEILDPDSNDDFGKIEEEKFQTERKVTPQNEPDEADLFFFGSMAKIYKRFPRKEQAELRIQITNLISNAELRMIQSDASPTCSTPRNEGRMISSKANVSEIFFV